MLLGHGRKTAREKAILDVSLVLIAGHERGHYLCCVLINQKKFQEVAHCTVDSLVAQISYSDTSSAFALIFCI